MGWCCPYVRMSIRSVVHNSYGQDIARTIWPRMLKLSISISLNDLDIFMILQRKIARVLWSPRLMLLRHALTRIHVSSELVHLTAQMKSAILSNRPYSSHVVHKEVLMSSTNSCRLFYRCVHVSTAVYFNNVVKVYICLFEWFVWSVGLFIEKSPTLEKYYYNCFTSTIKQIKLLHVLVQPRKTCLILSYKMVHFQPCKIAGVL